MKKTLLSALALTIFSAQAAEMANPMAEAIRDADVQQVRFLLKGEAPAKRSLSSLIRLAKR